ncbi:suppressor APC domain-containing protein 2 [Conger conger]|uniref:suppressor APC domain-containing protein 2 n=1 Tax=Conger conger TaxID=82655 RepID=UPI002A5AFE5F|nr:suppressor APC domain-containing protein 2 [Conger conger]
MALIANDRNYKLGGSTSTCTRLGVRRDCIPSKAGGVIHSKMQPTEEEFSTDGLPKAFLHSLRTLFDILDDGKRGFIHISEIESRWQGADTQDLPGGVLECLRRVAPPHGYLAFERFVAGLRYSMLNPHNGQLKPQSTVQQPPVPSQPPGMKLALPPSHQAFAQKHPGTVSNSSLGPWGVENKVRPLGPSNGTNLHQNRNIPNHNHPRQHEDFTCGYAPFSKPGESLLYPSASSATAGCPGRYSKAGYERTGRSLERIPNVIESSSHRTDTARTTKQPNPHQNRVRSIESLALESPHAQKPSAVEGGGLPRSQSETTTGLAGSRRHGRSRGEQRRHTITNGVDYGMLKQMKELEQEKDSLLSGLDVVDRAREWYQSQIQSVAERQRAMGQSSQCSDFFTESSQTRLNAILPKLQEVNRCLNDLISCSGMPFTASGTLAPIPPNPQPAPPPPPQAVQRLKDQNRLLTQEVTEKSERITQLEQEKSALIKQLFEARARSTHDSSTLDSTFI